MLIKDETIVRSPSIGTEVTLQRLLVAYDFSAFAEVALQYAIQLAREHMSEIIVAYVEAPSEFEANMEGGLGSVRAARDQAQLDVKSIAERIRGQGIASAGVCRMGAATDVLVQLAVEFTPDLILLGAFGHRRADTERLGSTAEYLLRCLPCASLTVGPEVTFAGQFSAPHRHIIYASSIPTRLGRAARFAEMFARRWGAEVEIMHVIDDQSANYDCRKNAELDIRGAGLAEKFRDMGIDAQWHLWVGSPADKIVERARELAAGMVIFGVEHHTLDPSIFGIISATTQRAVCPVLTVPGLA